MRDLRDKDPVVTARRRRVAPMRFAWCVPAILPLLSLSLVGCGDGDAVIAIALHPAKPHILYVSTNESIFKTRDTGHAWENVARGMSPSRVIALAVDPLLPANVYAGTSGDSVFRSFNGGQMWQRRNRGMATAIISSVVHDLAFVPGAGHHLFAATSMGVFETTTSGQYWIKRMNGMVEVLMVLCLDVDPNQPQTLYAGTSGGVYQSHDGADTWTQVNNGLVSPDVLQSSRALNVVAITIDRHATGVVYAATLSGLYRTTDGGASWQRIGASLPDQFFSDVALDPVTPGVVFVASRVGVHTSRDGGHTWRAVNDGLTNLNIRAMAIDHAHPATLYVGTNRAGLFRTTDGGQHWEPVPLTATTPQAL